METELSRKRTAQGLQTDTDVQASSVAFALSIAGLAIQTVVAVAFVAIVALATWAYNVLPSNLTADWTVNVDLGGFSAYIVFTAIVLAVGYLGAWWLRSHDSTKIRIGATLVLVAALFSVTTVWGLFLGSILAIIGSIVGFTTIQKTSVLKWG